jgi:LacI family transcriptional regulator
MVFADRVRPQGSLVDTVAADNRDAGEIASRYLLALGHADIVLAASNLSISPIRERIRGASDLICAETGRAPTVVELGSNAERGAEVFARWLERHDRPSAVIALTNVTTLSTMTACARSRIDIPDPVSVIGFDDYPWMSARKTGLTAIRQPIAEMAAAAWEQLRKRMAGDQSKPRQIVLKTSLQVRDSVLALRRSTAADDASAPDGLNVEADAQSPKAMH